MDRLAAMEAYVRVIDSGSFSSAALQLKIGQSAVSKTIAQLEEWLGVKLLLRSTRSLQATEAGQEFYERAKRTLQEADDAEAAARGTAAGLSGKLRVSASVCFARLHILPQLPAFLAKHPGLELEVMLDDKFVDLVEEGIDVALRTGALKDASLTARKIGRARNLVMGTEAYFAGNGVPKTPSDLASHRAIIRSGNRANETITFTQGNTETAVKLKGPLRVSSTEGVREAVLANLGIVVISEWLFTPELASGVVKAVLQDWTLPPHELSAVYSSGRRASAKTRAFVTFIESCMKAEDAVIKSWPRLNVVRAS